MPQYGGIRDGDVMAGLFISGLLEMCAAALFVVIASRKRLAGASKTIVMRKIELNWQVQPAGPVSASDPASCLRDALIVNGIRCTARGSVRSMASRKGVIYNGNVADACELLQNSTHPIVLDSELGILYRKLYASDPRSGIVAAHVMYGRIKTEGLHV